METIMKTSNFIPKLILVLLIGFTFYTGILQGPLVAYIMTGSFETPNPFFSGTMLGFFILFLKIAVKSFK